MLWITFAVLLERRAEILNIKIKELHFVYLVEKFYIFRAMAGRLILS